VRAAERGLTAKTAVDDEEEADDAEEVDGSDESGNVAASWLETPTSLSSRRSCESREVLSFLALLVQKYKY
jgi:hypothetical protein